MLIAVIVACEIVFWVVLLAGLAVRYVLRRPRASAIVLACVPLVDLVLLVVAVIDLRHGGTAQTAHALAAVYIGVSVGFGPDMIHWADQRVAHRFAGGPPPVRPPRGGREHARHERRMWLKHLLAWAVGLVLLGAGIVMVGDLERTQALWRLAGGWTVVLAVDFLWSMSYTIWPHRSG